MCELSPVWRQLWWVQHHHVPALPSLQGSSQEGADVITHKGTPGGEGGTAAAEQWGQTGAPALTPGHSQQMAAVQGTMPACAKHASITAQDMCSYHTVAEVRP
jgi:hypothetical protein